MSSSESEFPRIFSGDKTSYMEAHPRLGLVYIFESEGNKLIQIVRVDELKEHLKRKEKELNDNFHT